MCIITYKTCIITYKTEVEFTRKWQKDEGENVLFLIINLLQPRKNVKPWFYIWKETQFSFTWLVNQSCWLFTFCRKPSTWELTCFQIADSTLPHYCSPILKTEKAIIINSEDTETFIFGLVSLCKCD